MNRHIVVTTIMALVMSVMAPFAGVANAVVDYAEDGSTGNYLCTFGGEATHLQALSGLSLDNMFYRTRSDAVSTEDIMAYGYGYGYSAAAQEFQYGYGYGYGYGAFCSMNGGEMAARPGYFFFQAGSSPTMNLSAVISGGEVTVPDDMSLSLTGDGEGAELILPAGLVMSNVDWDGTIDVTYDETAPDGMDSANVVNVVFGGVDSPVELSGAAVVKVPYPDFDTATTNPTVIVTDMAGTPYTLSTCTDLGYYTAGDLADPASYDGIGAYSDEGAQHCYEYASDVVYVATNHFSSFAAGEGTADETPPSGGGSSGYYKKTVKKVAEAKLVTDFTDLKTLKTTDWEYPVVLQMMELGLFKGSLNAQGNLVFNMYGNMNRAEAATVIARYLGYNDKTVVTEAPFTDVPASEWYASSVSYLKSKGVVNGKTATKFAPADQVSRAEFFKMMVEAYVNLHPEVKAEWDGLMAAGGQPFADVSLKHWSYKYMRLASAKSLLSGYTEGNDKMMKPDKSIFRVEGGAIISKIMAVK